MVGSLPKKQKEVGEVSELDVRGRIAKHLDIDSRRVTDGAHLFNDLGADWLDHLELMIVIEEHFPGMEISDEDAEAIQTVGDLIRYVTSWHQRATAPTREPGAFSTGRAYA